MAAVDPARQLVERPPKPIYFIHVRKTAGSSFFRAFDGVGGIDHSHAPAWSLDLPADTFTVTILRDPVRRVLSYYRYLHWARANPDAVDLEPTIAAVVAESALLQGGPNYVSHQLRNWRTESAVKELGLGQFTRRLMVRGSDFGAFLGRVPPRKLLTQLWMFSRAFDPDEAAERVLECDAVLFTETYSEDLEALGATLGLKLEEKHQRRFQFEVEVDAPDRNRLRERLLPEYEMLERVRAGLDAKKSARPGLAAQP
jgi:hypothetical protein